jgi:hypothetical protein
VAYREIPYRETAREFRVPTMKAFSNILAILLFASLSAFHPDDQDAALPAEPSEVTPPNKGVTTDAKSPAFVYVFISRWDGCQND